ncbi:MAG TPA: c-type cytochrome [Polyangiales bacterium]|nr:c-type cytochrome [Polyangiales bacterium]
MLSRSQAKAFFLVGTILTTGSFLVLTVHSFAKVPELTNADKLDERVQRGKALWDRSNCMGCHTLLGEGGYYAPELTLVYERRGPTVIRAMLTNPEAMYPGQRRMQKYDFTNENKDDLIAFFQWVGQMQLNGFPPRPILMPLATVGTNTVVKQADRPKVFNQLCIACHSLEGQGGAVGPRLDGVGSRMTMNQIEVWLHDPAKVKPGTAMPNLGLSEEAIRELAAFLSTRTQADAAPATPALRQP